MFEDTLERRRQLAQALQALAVLIQSPLCRQVASQQQPRHLFKGRMCGEVFNGVPAIGQTAPLLTDGAQNGLAGDHTGQTGG